MECIVGRVGLKPGIIITKIHTMFSLELAMAETAMHMLCIVVIREEKRREGCPFPIYI